MRTGGKGEGRMERGAKECVRRLHAYVHRTLSNLSPLRRRAFSSLSKKDLITTSPILSPPPFPHNPNQTQFPRDRHGRINTADVFRHIYHAVCLEKTRITLHFYDQEGKGMPSLPSLPPSLPPSLLPVPPY